jgi:hypothetical protein
MFSLAQGAAGPTDVALPPEWESVIRYYEAAAPDELRTAVRWPQPQQRLAFRRHELSAPEGESGQPAIAHVRLVDLAGDGRLDVVASDMRQGLVVRGRPYDPAARLEVIATIPHPSRIEPSDFDGDGILDLLVADLGTFRPSNETKGSVVWLRGMKDGTYKPLSIDGWPRVADVRAEDFDDDGRLDLAVAAFGWRAVGNLTILRNATDDYSQPSFAPVRVDSRTGAVDAKPVDLNRDGRMDLVALFAQEHETVVAFLNTGRGLAFEPQTVYRAPHAAWGSSGIEVADIDGDGDLDVLLTNGDMMDDALMKPYHGITWLENQGRFPFTSHRLAQLPGALRAQLADLDGDGDLDIVACALVPLDDPRVRALPALVWLEHTAPDVFEPRTLKLGRPVHATMDTGDYDGDGDIDIVLGYMPDARPGARWIEVWENRRVTDPRDDKS